VISSTAGWRAAVFAAVDFLGGGGGRFIADDFPAEVGGRIVDPRLDVADSSEPVAPLKVKGPPTFGQIAPALLAAANEPPAVVQAGLLVGVMGL